MPRPPRSAAGRANAPTAEVPVIIPKTDAHTLTRAAGTLHPLVALCVDARGVADLLGIGLRTVRAMNARGALPIALKVGRRRLWRVAEIRDWVDAGCPPRTRWHWKRGGER